MRNVALFASQRSSTEFNKYWPAVSENGEVKKFVWGTKEEAQEMIAAIQAAHKKSSNV